MKLTDLNILDIGHKLGVLGTVIGDENRVLVCLFPDQTPKMTAGVEVLELNDEDWKKMLFQLDVQETEILTKGEHGDLVKAIVRKSQRTIEARISWAVYKRDGYACRYCGKDGIPLTVDHLVLWEEGGPSTEENLVASCRRCNRTRANLHYEEWLTHPYYLKVSANLSDKGRQANEGLASTLSGIPRRYSARATRK